MFGRFCIQKIKGVKMSRGRPKKENTFNLRIRLNNAVFAKVKEQSQKDNKGLSTIVFNIVNSNLVPDFNKRLSDWNFDNVVYSRLTKTTFEKYKTIFLNEHSKQTGLVYKLFDNTAFYYYINLILEQYYQI